MGRELGRGHDPLDERGRGGRLLRHGREEEEPVARELRDAGAPEAAIDERVPEALRSHDVEVGARPRELGEESLDAGALARVGEDRRGARGARDVAQTLGAPCLAHGVAVRLEEGAHVSAQRGVRGDDDDLEAPVLKHAGTPGS